MTLTEDNKKRPRIPSDEPSQQQIQPPKSITPTVEKRYFTTALPKKEWEVIYMLTKKATESTREIQTRPKNLGLLVWELQKENPTVHNEASSKKHRNS